MLEAAFMLLCVLVHKNPANQAAVWANRAPIEVCVSDGVGAEYLLAEVP